MDKVLHSTGNGEWGTPKDLFNRLHAKYCFDYDPASTHDNHLTDEYSTLNGTYHCLNHRYNEHTMIHKLADEDGLEHSWKGTHVFLNPPYGKGIASWVQKAATEPLLCVALLPVRTGTKWWQQWVMPFADIEFIAGRLRFEGAKWDAPFDSAIVRYR